VEAATAAYRSETDVLERFFAEECVFGPEEFVTRKGIFEAWQKWCDENGEFAETPNKFTRTLRERGVVKNFEEDRDARGERGWRGIGLRNSVTTPPSNPPSAKLTNPQKSWKHEGGETPSWQFGQEKGKVSLEPSRVDSFPQTDLKLPNGQETAKSSAPPPSPGETWTVDGLEIHYMPEGE
jgi:hypothetical protein